MMVKSLIGMIVCGALLGLVANLGGVHAGANSVASSRLSNTAVVIDANALKPTECAALNLTVVLTGSGEFEGAGANDLLLGTAASQKIRGRDGNDCVVGGAGTDELRGDAGTDVCIGSASSTFQDCETTVRRP